VGDIVGNQELTAEIERLKAEFAGADESKMKALEALIEQAAYERLYLKRLNEQALITGLVKIHPENAMLQKTLPIAGVIAKHSAALTNIMDKLMKHLTVEQDEDDDGLDEYE
jgi:phosphoribosyl-dephospho-CoA transferase